MKTQNGSMEISFKDRLLYLLVPLVLTILLYPFLEGGGVKEVILQAIFSATLVSGVYVISSEKKERTISILLAIPTFLTAWGLVLFGRVDALVSANYILAIIFDAFIITRLLAYVLRTQKVDNNAIYAAVCAFLLMGVAWGTTYLLIEHLQPGSFLATYKATALTRADLIYFSYVTLTTT